MKKFVSFALALMVALSVCATSLAATSCSNWLDSGRVTNRTCQAVGCGYASWMSVMKGSKEHRLASARATALVAPRRKRSIAGFPITVIAANPN